MTLVALVAGKEAPVKERYIKVYEAPGRQKAVPRILLQGDWLSSIGYHIGDHIKVSYQDNRLIVELANAIPASGQLSGK
jgi:hypothetical protein